MKPKILDNAAILAEKGAYLFVITANAEGYPHAAPAARLRVIPDNGEVEVDAWFCPGTLGNLEGNRRVALVVWDAKLDQGYQLLGRNESVEDIVMMDGYDVSLARKSQLPQVERRLKVRVEKVIPFQRGGHTDEEIH
jgi:uncharacterized protein